jgi:hypothetical protein
VILATPWLLWLLPLAGLPVLWHLFMKPQRRAAAFPSLMFFLSRQPRLEQRRKLREWLILALRVLLLALLITGLAGPRLPAVGGGGAPALAIIVDTSASMGLPDTAGRPLARTAAETAAALLAAMPAGGRAVIVPTAADPALALSERTTADRAALTTALDRITATEAAGDAAGSLARAAAALADDPAADREIRILSDLQAGEWDVAARLPSLPAGVRVTVHRLRPRGDGAGVDLARVLPPPGRVISGRPARLTAELANRGRGEATVGLRIATAGGDTLHDVRVDAGGTASVPVLITPERPGPAWAWLTLTGGGVAQRGGAAVWAQDRIAVLLCGPVEAYGPLPLALAPDGRGELTGLVPMAFDPKALPRAGLVVATWDAVPDVRAWVEAGGTLLLLPATAPAQPPIPPAWTGLRPLSTERFDTPMATVLADAQARCWEQVRDAAGAIEARLRVARAWPLAGDGARTALALADGRPLLLERDLGKGLVVGLGVAFHPGWSDLPLKGWSLALLHGLALRGAAATRAVDLVAGSGFPPAPNDKRPVQLRTLAGGPGNWTGPRERLPAPVRAGVYQLDGLGEPVVIAVRAAPGEGLTRYAEGSGAALLAGLGARDVAISTPADAVADWQQQRRGLDLTPWLLLLALLAWLVEGAIASRGQR